MTMTTYTDLRRHTDTYVLLVPCYVLPSIPLGLVQWEVCHQTVFCSVGTELWAKVTSFFITHSLWYHLTGHNKTKKPTLTWQWNMAKNKHLKCESVFGTELWADERLEIKARKACHAVSGCSWQFLGLKYKEIWGSDLRTKWGLYWKLNKGLGSPSKNLAEFHPCPRLYRRLKL